MAETLKTIASSTSKLREQLKDSKRDLLHIRLLLSALEDGLKSLWPFDGIGNTSNPAAKSFASSSTDADDRQGTGHAIVSELIADPMLWKETLLLVASGRIVGVVAQAQEAMLQAPGSDVQEKLWVGDGKLYTRWIGRGAVWMMQDKERGSDAESTHRAAAQLLGKGLAIGYLDDIVDEVTRSMIIEQATPTSSYFQLISRLTNREQRLFVAALLRYLAKALSRESLSSPGPTESSKTRQDKAIAATAALLQGIVTAVPSMVSLLIDFLVTYPQSTGLARAVFATLLPETYPQVLKNTWSQFSDNLHIQHVPILSQEANACVLLLAAGYVHRSDHAAFLELARSGMHNTAISEHLKNSSERVRWLGMCVGMAISGLVDEEGQRMDFGVEDMQTDEAKAIRGLVHVKDDIGSVDDLRELFAKQKSKNEREMTRSIASDKTARGKGKTATSTTKTETSKPKIIQVVDDDGEEEEDDDLIPYAKPDSDDPDSDEDANLANKKKPVAPVYIRDLITNLSETSDEPSHTLALRSAASLIRRKAGFGSELHDRTTELAQCLVSLQDQFDTENWHELRQGALIALIIAEPKIMGPWLARTLFEGDLSIAQRIAVVTAIGLGGRELAGFKADDDGQMAKVDTETAAQQAESSWPTKKLTGRLHEIYGGDSGASIGTGQRDRQLKLEARKVEALTRKMEQVLLKPVSTKERTRPRKKMLKNELAAVVADYFFFPLTRYWEVYSRAIGRFNNPLQHPILVSLTVKTLSILLTAAGPATTSLPQLTKEFFILLLSLRSMALQDPPVLEAILFALLTLLDVHSRETLSAEMAGLRWLAEECGSPLVEFREWVSLVWERLDGGSGTMKLKLDAGESRSAGVAEDEESQRCRVLAASVLVKIGEIVETYQRLLVGELSRV